MEEVFNVDIEVSAFVQIDIEGNRNRVREKSSVAEMRVGHCIDLEVRRDLARDDIGPLPSVSSCEQTLAE